MLISVCVCTFRRPALLAALLDGLARQQLDEPVAQLEILVVDNDPAHSAREVLQGWVPPAGFSLRFAHVPVPNISVARNAAVAMARGEWIAMIDDDEVPQPDWLAQLLRLQRKVDADFVAGPVLPTYPADTPLWVIRGGYFESRRYPSGTRINEGDGGTCNVLFRAASLKKVNGPFDENFGRTGGEDSLLFRDLIAAGCSYVWCDEAVIHEVVHRDRTTVRWMLRRSFRIGQTFIRGELYRLSGLARLAQGSWLFARATLQLVVSLALALAWLPASRLRSFRWIRIAAAQAGKLTGLSRLQYLEYGG